MEESKEIPSLQTKILASLSYEKLRSICFTGKLTALRGALDCSWGVWRDRAREELGIPDSFFDLSKDFPHPLTGLERYLTLYTYFHLSSLSSVKVYSNGSIEGVYESLAGAKEALVRESLPGLDVFLPRLTPVGKAFLLEDISGTKPTYTGLEILRYFGEIEELPKKPKPSLLERVKEGDLKAFQTLFNRERSTEISQGLIEKSIRSGRVDFVDALLPYMYPELAGYSIETNVPVLPYNELLPPGFLELPQVSSRVNLYDYLYSAVYSCNPQLLDFFIELSGTNPRNVGFLAKGYTFHRNTLGAYANLLRFHENTVTRNPLGLFRTGNLDLIYLFWQRFIFTPEATRDMLTKTATKIIENNLGNIPVIIAFLPYVEKNKVFIAKIRPRFPLTTSLLERNL